MIHWPPIRDHNNYHEGYWGRLSIIECSLCKSEFTPKLSVTSVECPANQRPHFGRDDVSNWLEAQRSTLTALV
ncbi:hypothetical protein TNCV_3772661 [Trichonephila clavipes]|nr:hypothetical protein TNCV_3772661 [Trichonephila clavipes]